MPLLHDDSLPLEYLLACMRCLHVVFSRLACSETPRERSKQTPGSPFLRTRREHTHAYVIDLCTEIYVFPSGECEQGADPIQTAAIRIESRLHSVNRALVSFPDPHVHPPEYSVFFSCFIVSFYSFIVSCFHFHGTLTMKMDSQSNLCIHCCDTNLSFEDGVWERDYIMFGTAKTVLFIKRCPY